MKIIGIKFLNLNSLKGEHEIRFDQPPFTESGIFAITGPTGAGKTTLLDAITVSLYGRVHRHTKDVFEIMTRHTAESYAEVEFEVGQKTYRAKWSIRRSRGKADGQLQTQKMELAELPSGRIIIEHPLNEVKEEIVKLCGLDYHQFLRSVILSQGDFTRFLKADENERSELLEKITDTGIYSEISIAAYDKARTERIALEQLKNRLENVVLLSDEQREIYRNELEALALQEKEQQSNEAELRAKIDWLMALERLEARKQELLSKLSEYELYYVTHESRFDQLQKHLNALVHRPALAELQTIEKQQLKIESDLQEATLAYPLLLKEEAVISSSIHAAKDQLAKVLKALAELEPVFDAVLKKDILITQSRALLEQQGNTLKLANQELETSNLLFDSLKAALLKIGQRFSELTSWLSTHEADAGLDKELILFEQLFEKNNQLKGRTVILEKTNSDYQDELKEASAALKKAAENIGLQQQKLQEKQAELAQSNAAQLLLLGGRTLEELEQEYRTFPLLIHTSEQQIKLASQALQFQQEQQAAGQQILQITADLQTANGALLALQEQSVQEAQQLEHLQQIHDLEVKVQNFDKERLMLQVNEPCPLCGSVHHPFVEGNHIGRVSESAERRNLQQLKVNTLKAAIDQETVKQSILNSRLETAIQLQETLKNSLSQVFSEFDSNNLKLPKPLDILKPAIITAVIARKKLQEEELSQQLIQIKNAQVQISGLETTISQLKEQLSAENNKSEQQHLRISLTEKQMGLLAVDFASLNAERTGLQLSVKAISTKFGISDAFDNAEQTITFIQERFTQYKKLEQELSQLQLDRLQKETEQNNTGQLLVERGAAVKKAEFLFKEQSAVFEQLQKERLALFGDKDPLELRNQLTADQKKYQLQVDTLQQQLNQKQQNVRVVEDRQQNLNTSFLATKQHFSQHLEKLTTQLQAEGLTDIQELNRLFLPEEEAAAASQLQKEASQNIISCKSLLSATAKDQETELAKALTPQSKVELAPELEAQRAELATLQQGKGKLIQILADDDQLKLKHLEVARQIAGQQKEFDRFQQLSALIGSADGKKFSRFAQGLTLARLTELANRHLQRLSERYSIFKSPEKDLDLQIIDHYQADVLRPMSTLSGGESFLVSLALALGLSDLASRKVQINSLFIDEGFGTLDAETLDTALTALENLQAAGKSIGVISHIEALKERIGTQIQLSREAGGTSKISVVNYGLKV